MMVQIAEDLRAPLCAGLTIVFCLLDTLPSFPASLAYQNTSPIITGFAPEAYAQQPWLGLHSLDLAHTPPPDSHRKAKDVLKEAILCSTGGNAATTVSTGPSTSTSTTPKQTRQDADELPWEGLPSTSSPTAHSPTKHKCTSSPSLCHSQSGSSSSGRGSASDRGSRGSHSSSLGSGSRLGSGSGSHDGSPARSEASRCEGSVHLQAASDGSVKILSADEASGGKEDVLDSANKTDVSQGSMSLLDISAADDEDTHKCKVCKIACKSDTDFVAWRDKLIHDRVAGIQEWDSMVNDYADPGKRRPKNPDTIGPPFPT